VKGHNNTPILSPAPTEIVLDVRVTDPDLLESDALRSHAEDPQEYVAVSLGSMGLACQGLAHDGALVFVIQIAFPPGLLDCQTKLKASRIVDPQGQSLALMQAVNHAIKGCRPDVGLPPTIRMLIRKDALDPAVLQQNEGRAGIMGELFDQPHLDAEE